MKYLFSSILALFVISAIGQNQKIGILSSDKNLQLNVGTKSNTFQVPLFKEIIQNSSGNKWTTSVRPTFSREHGTQELIAIKEQKLQTKTTGLQLDASENSTMSVTPEVGVNFEGNWSLQGTPPDNAMAISNGGFIVTCNNDGIEMYNDNGTFLSFDYWTDFFNDGSLASSLFDPKVIYDSQEDRFILIVLHGSTPSTSQVLVSFSKTNDPQAGWWTYKLTGDPNSDGSWFDYPSIGISNDEVFVSGNLFSSAGSFNEAVVYQIEKSGGLSGSTLNWQYFNGLSSTPYSAFTLVPVSNGHQGNYGPGIYLVSNAAGGSNSIRFWEITNTIASGSASINSTAITVPTYSPSADAAQQGSSDKLDNGDCRIQNGFYLEGTIHFVFHSDIGNGWNGINYNRLNIAAGTIDNSTFGLSGSFDYSYPAVASFTNTTGDKSVMIAFLRSSSAIFPELRVVNCDHLMAWSSSTQVKAGEAFVDFLSGDERWGDYTGIARKHNSPAGNIWLAGCYGADIVTNQGTFPNTFKTHVAEIYSSQTPPLSIAKNSISESVKVFPNPVVDWFELNFESLGQEVIDIEIIDQSGKLVKLLYHDSPKTGENRLMFNRGALNTGSYFIKISTENEIIKNEKIVILD